MSTGDMLKSGQDTVLNFAEHDGVQKKLYTFNPKRVT